MKNSLSTIARTKKLLLCILYLAHISIIQAQINNRLLDSIADKMSWYAQSKAYATLFVHLDKNVYSPTENLKFAAYLLKSFDSLSAHHTLSVALLGNNDKRIWASEQCVIVKGLSSGMLLLPDSLPAGNYTFLAYTNQLINGNPEALSSHAVTIKTPEPSFRASLTLGSTRPFADSVVATLKVLSPQLLALPSAEVRYSQGNTFSQLLFTKTNSNGEVAFSFPTQSLTPENNTLHVQVNSGGESKTFRLLLPTKPSPPQVRFFPEGGHLVNGLAAVVGWEAKTAGGKPKAVRGVLYEGQTHVDTVQTDSQGFGRFTLTPKGGQVYTVKLLKENTTDTSYLLPAVLHQGVSLMVRRALANDTLRIELQNNLPNQPLYLLLHNFGQLFEAFPLNTAQKRTLVAIALDDLPKGLTTLTLLDSTGRPWGERVFFAHWNQRSLLEVQTDSTTYHTRSKVTLRIKLKDKNGKPTAGLLSLACVQARRLDTAGAQDIESYTYLTHALADLPFTSRPFTGDKEIRSTLEDALLVRGWCRYTWAELMAVNLSDTAVQRTSLVFTGMITQNGKPLKKAVSLSVLNGQSLISTLSSDKSGNFVLPAEVMATTPGQKLNVLVNVSNQPAYQIKINNPYEKMNEKLAQMPVYAEKIEVLQREDIVVQTENSEGAEQGKLLQTVVVTSRKKEDKDFYEQQFIEHPLLEVHEGKCTDYVCISDYLNCPMHATGRPPIKGQVYYVVTRLNGVQRMVYHNNCKNVSEGRNSVLYPLNGLYINNDIYMVENVLLPSLMPVYYSTLYWSPSIVVEENNEVTVSFYTSDLEGKFKVIVQGRTNDDVVYGEALFAIGKQ